jgi:hypothetical protein
MTHPRWGARGSERDGAKGGSNIRSFTGPFRHLVAFPTGMFRGSKRRVDRIRRVEVCN